MKSKAITRILLVTGMTALLLTSSAAGLAVGQAVAITANSTCDNVCVDASCVDMPTGWLEPIPIADTFILYPTRACLYENGARVKGEGEFFLPNIQTDQGTDGRQRPHTWPSAPMTARATAVPPRKGLG
jgi:hypothetical protein